MNQQTSNSGRKPGARDFINLGIFTVIYLILFLACIMLMSMTVYTLPFGVALGSFVAASAYMLLRAKTPKTGAIVIFGTLFGLVMFGMGSGLPILLSVVTGSVLAELISRSGDYRCYVRETIAYAVLMLATAIGSYIPFLVMREYYLKIAEGNSINAEFMANLMNFITAPYLAAALIVTIIGAVLGAAVARGIFKKHLIKAGLLKETM